ncbi:hypothetical protein ACFQ0M_10525 [Kitasatospora aburaviensis]
MSLENLGLTRDQERLYRYLLRTPGPADPAAAAGLGLPERLLRAVLAELQALGVVDAGGLPCRPRPPSTC